MMEALIVQIDYDQELLQKLAMSECIIFNYCCNQCIEKSIKGEVSKETVVPSSVGVLHDNLVL